CAPGAQSQMKFRVYVRRDNRLRELYRIKRTKTGLYFNEVYDAMKAGGAKLSAGSTSTYHEDGRSWEKLMGSRNDQKVINPPLADFSGALTLRTMICTISSMGWNSRPEDQVALRPEDVVCERTGVFGIEVILSDKALDLPTLPDRPNS